MAGQGCLCFWLSAVLSGHHYVLGQPYGSDAYVEADLLVGGAAVFTQKYSFYDNLNQLVDDGAPDAGGWDPLTATPIQWRHLPWTQFCFDLSAYAGQAVTLRVTAYDCDAGGHYAIAYLDDVSWGSCAPPQMALEKSVSPAGPVAAGSTLTYTLHYQNTGTAADNDVVICDSIPADSTFTGALGSSPAIPAVSWTGTQPGDSLCWFVGYVPAGVSGSLSFTVTVDTCGGLILVLALPVASALGALRAAPQPAPANGSLRLAWPGVPNARLVWGLYSLEGSLVLQGEVDAALGRVTLDLGPCHLAQGLYLLELRMVGQIRTERRLLNWP